MTDQQIIEAVKKLNAEVFSVIECERTELDFRTNGTNQAVYFMDALLWCCDDDYLDGADPYTLFKDLLFRACYNMEILGNRMREKK